MGQPRWRQARLHGQRLSVQTLVSGRQPQSRHSFVAAPQPPAHRNSRMPCSWFHCRGGAKGGVEPRHCLLLAGHPSVSGSPRRHDMHACSATPVTGQGCPNQAAAGPQRCGMGAGGACLDEQGQISGVGQEQLPQVRQSLGLERPLDAVPASRLGKGGRAAGHVQRQPVVGGWGLGWLGWRGGLWPRLQRTLHKLAVILTVAGAKCGGPECACQPAPHACQQRNQRCRACLLVKIGGLHSRSAMFRHA